jgi:Replication initiation factor
MADYTTEVVQVGVDWITVSAERGPKAELLNEYGARLIGLEQGRAQRVYEASSHGLAGLRTRHAGWLWNLDRVVVELHEHLAHDQWADAAELSDNCSRLDVEVTVRQEPFDRQLAIREWDDSLHRRTEVGKEPYYDLYARRRGGNTLYIGTGASRYKARLYDKGRESRSPVYKDCWRYEVQARRERAVQMAERLRESADVDADVVGLVHQHFASRGVVPIFDPRAVATLRPLPRPASDAERSLAWLESAWKPTIERLSQWNVAKEAWKRLNFRFDPHTGEQLFDRD